MKQVNFIERRKEYRLPFQSKTIFTDGTHTATAYASNISRGGIFVMSLEPFPIETNLHATFCLPNQLTSFTCKAKVAHIVYDRQRCEVDNGMGFQFLDLEDAQKSLLNLHIIGEQTAYLELKRILLANEPDADELSRALVKIPWLAGYDLLKLRYKVNRICTIFEASLNTEVPSPIPKAG